MKLKPIALAIPMVLAAGSVSAAEIYNQDSNSVELSGWVKAFGHVTDKDVVEKDDDGYVKHEKAANEKDGFHVKTDAEVELKATHQVDEASKVIGSFVIKMGDSTSDDKKNAQFDDVKFEYDHAAIGNISLGDTGNSFGVLEKAEAGEGDNVYLIKQGGVEGQGIRYKKSVGNFNFSANYETDSAEDYDSNYALSAEYAVEDSFSAAVAYSADGDNASSIGLAGDIHFGELRLGAAFISFEDGKSIEINDGVEHKIENLSNDGQSYSLVAEYDIDKVTVYGSYQMVTGEADNADVDAQLVYIGADYNFTDSVKAYLVAQTGTLEVGTVEQESTGFKFGAKYSF
ncbi:porin [Vibrio sp. JC009]|uniref:porin n=1 Tax=Vibrio sp. JC009 TaxID=2912314 RepID=UPI0023AF3B9C|nr:porin [Vibrio sp. JC009]WED21765.1 porin [Vibrio sp. JC009]